MSGQDTVCFLSDWMKIQQILQGRAGLRADSLVYNDIITSEVLTIGSGLSS